MVDLTEVSSGWWNVKIVEDRGLKDDSVGFGESEADRIAQRRDMVRLMAEDLDQTWLLCSCR